MDAFEYTFTVVDLPICIDACGNDMYIHVMVREGQLDIAIESSKMCLMDLVNDRTFYKCVGHDYSHKVFRQVTKQSQFYCVKNLSQPFRAQAPLADQNSGRAIASPATSSRS